MAELRRRVTDTWQEIVSLSWPIAIQQLLNTLMRELETVSRQGYAVNDGEVRKGLRCIGAPVTRDGEVVGALSVSGPVGRIHGDRFEEEIPEMVMNAANIVEITVSYS